MLFGGIAGAHVRFVHSLDFSCSRAIEQRPTEKAKLQIDDIYLTKDKSRHSRFIFVAGAFYGHWSRTTVKVKRVKIAPYVSLLMSLIIFVGVSRAGQSEQNGLQTFSGEVMDDICAKDRTHAKMMAQMKSMGNDPVVCSRKCHQLGAKYVLYDREKNTVYGLADQDKAEQFAGQKVRISGTLDKKRIKIAKIEQADSGGEKTK